MCIYRYDLIYEEELHDFDCISCSTRPPISYHDPADSYYIFLNLRGPYYYGAAAVSARFCRRFDPQWPWDMPYFVRSCLR
jgi:hypothetical protein